MDRKKIIHLFKKYVRHECSEEEIRLLMTEIEKDEYEALFRELIAAEVEGSGRNADNEQEKDCFNLKNTDNYFEQNFFIKERNAKSYFLVWKIFAAAVVICVSAFIVWKYLYNRDSSTIMEEYATKGLLLTGDGSTIAIHVGIEKKLYEQDGVAIWQDSIGDILLKYSEQVSYKDETSVFQRIRTAKGGQLRVCLLDGSTIQLNSDSELKFPLFYNSRQREVDLKGEGYFDIRTNPDKPFLVKTRNQQIKVYGTKFNVRDYGDEANTMTTLFEGKITVQNRKSGGSAKEYVLLPGEQLVLNQKENVSKQLKTQNEIEILAWKKGLFIYENTSIKDIMRDFKHWYDIEIEVESLPDLTFSGTIPRSYKIDKALNLLERTADIKITRIGKIIKIER